MTKHKVELYSLYLCLGVCVWLVYQAVKTERLKCAFVMGVQVRGAQNALDNVKFGRKDLVFCSKIGIVGCDEVAEMEEINEEEAEVVVAENEEEKIEVDGDYEAHSHWPSNVEYGGQSEGNFDQGSTDESGEEGKGTEENENNGRYLSDQNEESEETIEYEREHDREDQIRRVVNNLSEGETEEDDWDDEVGEESIYQEREESMSAESQGEVDDEGNNREIEKQLTVGSMQSEIVQREVYDSSSFPLPEEENETSPNANGKAGQDQLENAVLSITNHDGSEATNYVY